MESECACTIRSDLAATPVTRADHNQHARLQKEGEQRPARRCKPQIAGGLPPLHKTALILAI
jgi:hypothetical protein